MKPVAVTTLRSRWFAACVHAALWLLLYLAVTHLGGQALPFRENDTFMPPPQSPAPIAKLEALLSRNIWPSSLAGSNISNPFVTSYFVPAPVPPPPPPPTTRKIELTYLGYYQTGDGLRQAVVKLFDTPTVAPVGGRVASNLFAAQVTMQTLTLTNPAAQTNILTVNKKQEIEVPLK